MLTYFCIYSFLGYIMESLYISCFHKKWYSSGLLTGPYIPLYGFGAIILIFISPYIKHSYFITFVVGSLLMTILEFLSSLFLEKVFFKRLWDYSLYPFNFQGRICLFYSLLWGLLSIILIKYIHPYLASILLFNQTSMFLSMMIIIIIIKDTLHQKKTLDITI